MPNRRDFLAGALAAGGASLMNPALTDAKQQRKQASTVKPLRVLILGGTGHLGSHFVPAALERGHRVSVFVRKGHTSKADLPPLAPTVEQLAGDRDGDLESIKHRDWDAVIDLATYGPGWVRSLGEALQGRVRHYTFISTIGVYESPGASGEADENSKLVEYQGEQDPYSLTDPGQHYGALKVLCEREAERQFPGRALILRPCYIVGPLDRVGVLTYWAARMEKGGEILAAGDPLARVHAIDVRDMAHWTLDMVERAEAGVFNAVGPAAPMHWGSLLKALRSVAAAPVKLTWVPISWLTAHLSTRTAGFNSLLFWPTQTTSGPVRVITNAKALARGLVLQPLSTTIADTLAWWKSQPAEQRTKWLAGIEGRQSLDQSMAREKDLLAAWHVDAQDS